MTNNYLVTGAAGFIAAAVVRLLLEEGHKVLGIDNLNDAYDPALKRWRLAQFAGRRNFDFREIDICDRRSMDGLLPEIRQGNYSAIINLAARAGVRQSVTNPWVYLQTNAEGTLNLLELCRQSGVTKFVLASTSSLYGGNNALPFREDDNTDRPLSPYAASKKAAEAVAFSYHHLHRIDVSVLRYFTVYGPAGRPDMSVFRFVRQIAEGAPITVFGDGSQSRDFTYVDDIARGTVAALRPVGYQVINLGGDRPVELNSIIQQISEYAGRRAVIHKSPAHPADVPATWASIEKAKALLGWSPQVTIENGLKNCVAWFFNYRELASSVDLGL